MRNLLNTMASLMKKFKRKRRLSSELDSRWGDPSISYPTQGSWNQRSQPSEFFINASPGLSQSPRSDEAPRYISLDSNRNRESNSPAPQYTPSDLGHADAVIPKGYFDESIRRREKGHRQPQNQGLGIAGTRHDRDFNSDDVVVSDNDDESCDEDDEERDTLGDPGRIITHRNYTPSDDYNSYPDYAAKSPPLSVTSRMRRISTQSSITEQSSMTGPASSRRTSYTAASSVSAPSLPPDTPRYAVHAHVDKRVAPRPRYRAEPAPTNGIGQGMVPSYDELYG